ncbi:MAG: hypothetical protein U5K84_05895 [Alkalibacterium sp.]|nr:hypothetical protein [Alkalibacterium sp.]
MVIDASRYLKSDVMFVGIILMGITGIMMAWAVYPARKKISYFGKEKNKDV